MNLINDNNLLAFLFTFLPALAYSILIYMSMPKGHIKFKSASLSFAIGVISAIAVISFHYIFPNWAYPIGGNVFVITILSCFLQIALVEETMKSCAFSLSNWYNNYSVLSPPALMFNSVMVAVGFAAYENLMYVQIYGDSVLYIRSISAVILHMICGIMFAYAYLTIKGKLKKIIVALSIVTAYHGLYDLNIEILKYQMGPMTMNMFFIIFIGLIISYLMADKLVEPYKKIDNL